MQQQDRRVAIGSSLVNKAIEFRPYPDAIVLLTSDEFFDPTRPVVFSGDKVPEPAQKRIRRDNSSELLEGFPSECSRLYAQPTPLLISESEPMAFAELLVYPDLFNAKGH